MLEYVNLDVAITKEEYKKKIGVLQQRLYELEHAVFNANIPVMILFEGWAATGKGRLINIVAERLDPRGFRVVPIKPPRTAETKYPWMWRFWQKIPARGQMVAYDTSWYQRVLSDRIKKVVKQSEWDSAYRDITEFEEVLSADGVVILKFWLHISKDELTNRLNKLRSDEITAWQVTEDDLLQKKKYEKYTEAIEDMLLRTDAPSSPWTIIEATDKYFARIKVLETIIKGIEDHLGLSGSAITGSSNQNEVMQGAVNA
jgi:polyphosphate kinase 2 (PPK2 family)